VTQLTVLFFGGLKESLACASEQVYLPDTSPPSLRQLYQVLCARHTRLPSLMASVRLAHNEEFLPGSAESAILGDTALQDGDVVAFIPPVTGG
jgi:molybdopterin converting factor small subunit